MSQYTELTKRLRKQRFANSIGEPCAHWVDAVAASDAIEQLIAENTSLRNRCSRLCLGKVEVLERNTSTMYEVWATQCQGGMMIESAPTLEIALNYVKNHEGEASFAIQYPNGRWHDWG